MSFWSILRKFRNFVFFNKRFIARFDKNYVNFDREVLSKRRRGLKKEGVKVGEATRGRMIYYFLKINIR